MARARTGTAQYVPAKGDEAMGHYRVRLTLEGGQRPWIHAPPSPESTAHAAAAIEEAKRLVATDGSLATAKRHRAPVENPLGAKVEALEWRLAALEAAYADLMSTICKGANT